MAALQQNGPELCRAALSLSSEFDILSREGVLDLQAHAPLRPAQYQADAACAREHENPWRRLRRGGDRGALKLEIIVSAVLRPRRLRASSSLMRLLGWWLTRRVSTSAAPPHDDRASTSRALLPSAKLPADHIVESFPSQVQPGQAPPANQRAGRRHEYRWSASDRRGQNPALQSPLKKSTVAFGPATGTWQVSGRDNVSYRRRVARDALYGCRKRVLLELCLITATVPAVLMRRSSYQLLGRRLSQLKAKRRSLMQRRPAAPIALRGFSARANRSTALVALHPCLFPIFSF